MASDFERICCDSWLFRVGLSDGSVFEFVSAEERGDWLFLSEATPVEGPAAALGGRDQGFEWNRPVQVRAASVVWVGDNGH